MQYVQLQSLAKTTEALGSITAVLNTRYSTNDKQLEALSAIGKSYPTETLKAAIAQSTLEKEQIKRILSASSLSGKQLKSTTDELEALIQSKKNASDAVLSLGDAFKGLGLRIKNAAASLLSFLNANPVGWAALAVGAIAGVIAGIKQYRKHIAEAAEEARQAAGEMADNYKELEANVSNTKLRYAELAQGVNQITGENKNLNTEEYNEFLDLSNQLAELFPSLTRQYTENGDAILNLSGNVDTIVSSLNGLVEAEKALANQEIIDKIPAILKGYNQDYSAALKELSLREEWQSKLQTAYDSLQNMDKVYFSRSLNNDNAYFQISEVLRELDIRYTVVNKSTEDPTSFGLVSFSFDNYEDYEAALAGISRALETAEKDVSNYNNKLKAENADFNKYLNTWLSDNWAYISLNDSHLQNVVRDMLFNTDWLAEAKAQGINTNNWDDVSKWIEDTYLLAIGSIDDDKVKNALLELYSLPSDGETAQEYTDRMESAFETVQAYCNENGIKLPISIDNKIGSINDLTDNVKAKLLAEFDGRVGELTYEELQIAAGLEIADDTLLSWDELITKIEKAKHSMTRTDPQTLFTRLTASQESLDTFRSSVKSAFDAYSTLLSGSYSSSELLDSIQAINQTVGDMGGSLNWEFIDSQSNSLEVLGNAIEYVSEQYANSILSDAGIDPGSDFGEMLAGNIIQAQKAAAQLEAVNGQIDSLQEAYQNLTDAVDTYNRCGHITFDQLQNLLGMEPQYLACLIDENGQLQLNRQAMQELADRRLYDARVQAVQQAISELGTLTHRDEQKAIADSAQTFRDSVSGISAYNEELAKTLAEAGIAAPLIRDLNAALSGAEERGASDADIRTVMDNLNAKMKLINSVDTRNLSGTSSSAVGQAETDWKSLLDKETDLLEKQLAANLIAFQEYIEKRKQIIEDYYHDGRISAEEYYDALESMYGSHLSLYDRAVNAVTGRIDDEIDRINTQKEAIENSYQIKIDAIQAEIDALNKANDARKAQIDLEKAQYEAERARNQRINRIYDGSQFVYTTDMEAVRDAEENLADRKIQVNISRLEAQIESLEREMENATKGLDSQIKALEAYKEKWNEISGIYEEQQNRLVAAEILGADWESQVLNGRLDTLRSFTEQYIALQQAQADAASNAARIKAEAAAGNTTGGSVRSTPSTHGSRQTDNGDDKDTSEQAPPKIQAKKSVPTTSSHIDYTHSNRDVTRIYATMARFHGGLDEGYATASGQSAPASHSLALLQKLADENLLPNELPAILQHGELVITPEQQRNIIANTQRYCSLSSANSGYAFQYPGDTSQIHIDNLTISCPNVTNNTGAEYILKSIRQLPLDNIQHSRRRRY